MLFAVVPTDPGHRTCCKTVRNSADTALQSTAITGVIVSFRSGGSLSTKARPVTVDYRLRSLSRFWVPAQQPVPADEEDFGEHAHAVAEDVELAVRVVRPAHGNFRSAQAVAFGQKKNLRVEPEPLDALPLENDARALGRKL